MNTASEIRAKAQAYFDDCDSTREKATLKNGEIIYRQVPYTVAGLCACLEITKDTLEKAIAAKHSASARDKAYAWALFRVEQHIVERALLGELNANVAGLVLKSWGYGTDESKVSGSVTVVLEDPENYGR